MDWCINREMALERVQAKAEQTEDETYVSYYIVCNPLFLFYTKMP